MPEVLKLGEFVEQRKSGEKIKYVVQTAPSEMVDEVVDHMTKFFIPREPLCSCKLAGDPEGIRALQIIWKGLILTGTTIVALQITDGAKPKLIGANVTPICNKNDEEKSEGKGSCFDLVEALADVAKRSNIYEKYGVDRYLSGYGLAVNSDYHGYNVGQRILECRRPLCESLGIKATGTVFSAVSSQYIASKVGFENLLELDYSTFTVNGKSPFAKLPGKMIMSGLKF